MGGTLWLKNLHPSKDDGDSDASFSYRYSTFQLLKGHILRWTITYLENLHAVASEKKEKDAKQFFLDAGLKAVAQCDDQEAVKAAVSIIKGALKILIPWKRKPTGREPSLAELEMMMRFGGLGQMGTMPGGMPAMPPHDDLLDMNYRSTKIHALERCPLELEMAGVRALYKIMLLPDNNILIFYEDAKMMGKFIDLLLGHLKDQKDGSDSTEDEDAWLEEMAGELRDILKECGENQYLVG
ncbi:hypothetical protein C8J56DRAFT_1172675 [Mycena floridula]|nr:hypothetical protein C8J56DRAFT_1172675 [Mycena floridula]